MKLFSPSIYVNLISLIPTSVFSYFFFKSQPSYIRETTANNSRAGATRSALGEDELHGCASSMPYPPSHTVTSTQINPCEPSFWEGEPGFCLDKPSAVCGQHDEPQPTLPSWCQLIHFTVAKNELPTITLPGKTDLMASGDASVAVQERQQLLDK